MYKRIQNKKYCLAVHIFNKKMKEPSSFDYAYRNGFVKWETYEDTTYAIVV